MRNGVSNKITTKRIYVTPSKDFRKTMFNAGTASNWERGTATAVGGRPTIS